MTTFEELQFIVKDQFLDIVVDIIKPSPDKLRLILRDKSFIDIRLSQTIRNRFDFHWERRHIDKTVYRYDNFPDARFKQIKTFPYHLHLKTEDKVTAITFRKTLPGAFTDFMSFARQIMKN